MTIQKKPEVSGQFEKWYFFTEIDQSDVYRNINKVFLGSKWSSSTEYWWFTRNIKKTQQIDLKYLNEPMRVYLSGANQDTDHERLLVAANWAQSRSTGQPFRPGCCCCFESWSQVVRKKVRVLLPLNEAKRPKKRLKHDWLSVDD